MNNSPLVFISEFVTVDHGKYIVKVSASENHVILGTALASGETVEQAEDKARQRAIEAIKWANNITLPQTSSTLKTTSNSQSESRVKKEEFTTTSFSPQSSTTKEATKIPAPIQPPAIPLNNSQPQPLPSPANNLNDSATVIAKPKPVSISSPSTTEELPSVTSSAPEPTTKQSEQPPITPIENETPQVQLDFSPTPEETNITTPSPSLQDETVSPPVTETASTMDFSQIINQTTIELKRLGWTQEDGKKYLLATYGKKSRHLLSDEELIEFLQYLQQQP